MITFSSKNFDLIGSVTVREDVEDNGLLDSSRRVSRTATLDGGVVIDDAGYTDGDRTFNVTVRDIAQDDLDKLRWIQSVHADHRAATRDGFFSGVIEDISFKNGDATIVFLVLDKLSQ